MSNENDANETDVVEEVDVIEERDGARYLNGRKLKDFSKQSLKTNEDILNALAAPLVQYEDN